ncbi:MAG TPA: metallophosphoesterase [Polyangiaceae bacterium]|nr:metallophosphoesterase [Polyangiaceae bacterium]
MSSFALLSVAAWLLVVACAWRFRSRQYAIFRAVLLGFQVLFASALFPRFSSVWPLFVYGHAAVFVQSLALIRPSMRGMAYRVLISIPGAFFGAGTLLSLPWVLLSAFGVSLPAPWAPYAIALLGVLQSLRSAEEQVHLVVADGESVPELKRHPKRATAAGRPLSIVQITDPHLGPFMSVARLRRICERAVARQPDLVLLTGDFLTMESQSDPELLGSALAPLAALPGRCFACFGNHDHEAPDTVRRALERAGVTLLIDDARELSTAAGPVQILGMDFVWRERKEHLARVCAKHPRVAGHLRIVLLHDPGAFRHLPEGEADLALSGHTHGGQVGLVSLGLDWTMMRLFVKAPDHGFWARGSDRLYVHRGTGHYGFPLRLGVPGEQSMLLVYAAMLNDARAATA